MLDSLRSVWELLRQQTGEGLERRDPKMLNEFYRPASEEATA